MGRLGVKLFCRSFTGHMIIGLLAIQVLLTPLLFYGILYFIERGFQSQFVDQVRNNTYLYSVLIGSAVVHGNVANQKAVLSEALLNEDLVLAEIIHPDGTVIRPDDDARPDELSFLEDFKYDEHGDHVYFIATPLPGGLHGGLPGSLRLGYDEMPTQRRIDVAYRYGSVLAFAYAALSIMMAIFFGRRLVRPIAQLQLLARSIATGDAAVDLKVSTNILEISGLTRDLDSMRQTLVDRHRDVTDREKRLYAILDNAGEGIISIDAKGVIGSFNQAAESIFGYTAGHVIGKNVSILMPPAEREHHDSYIQQYLTTGEAKIIGIGRRFNAQHDDGHLFPVYLTVTEIELDREHVYIGIVRDLTQEEEKDKRLLQFWRVVEQCPVSIVITDTHGVVEYVNPHFCQVTGYQPEEVFGQNPRFLKSGNTPTDTYQDLWKTISSGEIWRGEFQNKKKNGELFWESATICPVHDHTNKITHFVALKENITEHRVKDRMLTQAMKMEAVGRMTDGIAHDFNNLLTIILGNLQFLLQDIDQNEHGEMQELIADAMSAAYDGSNLIKQLLIFSRRKEPVSKPMELTTFMESMQYLLNRVIPEDIRMRLEVTGDIGTVLIDANRLESAILNLAINARDAMPDGGELVISLEMAILPEPEEVIGGLIPAGNYILLRIADNGIGMTEDIRRQAVEPFFTTKPGASGTGLGLSMVNDLIVQSGGGIRIESEPGIGTTIILILPMHQHSAELSTDDQEILDALPRGNETILVVEDKDKVRRFANRILSRLGYRLIEAENAAEAVKYLQTNNDIDLLFTDIVMPGDMDGRELAHHASSWKSTLKILLTTGMESRLEKNSRAHMDFPLLRKPYSAEQLAQSIRSVLNTGRLTS